MSGKAFFIDTTLCIGCRGCQIACKQWNQLPATKTKNVGSYQNPQDLSFYTYKLIRFQEHLGPDGKPVWYFFPDQCRHCVEPPCKETADEMVPGGIIIDSQTGAVLYTDKLKKANAKDIIEACPFNIPRAQKGTGYLAKCTMCFERVYNGLLPACVKTCPTGAMNFGDRDKMVELAKARFQEAKAKYPNATLTGIEDLRVFYLLADKPEKYYTFAKAEPMPKAMDRKMAMRKIGRSLKELAREWQAINKLVS
ncbi:MAG: 4Fe-4S dicluster domain-containing protein [Deltaproteobacteria bacterium]|nr:4Fe-4S dicluster domain-containing protein [Deltaproteobacteria bacterium]MBW1928138.1 4Fe-4S dicluster domain-containing protein [Deltaproteobacteria bacterium]MBW2025667.1 4Fe-4S dicluster domain-containing protein [Deltaproteobacteria bacterium]MBW2125641.1 4Fe-4S dicluster domain-containing protein [Deltaproteobacteria bacterium]RLB18106.1 MAG: formate dehydrogenase [Deltaproteobacteria bacterium]